MTSPHSLPTERELDLAIDAFRCTRHRNPGRYTCPFCNRRVKAFAKALSLYAKERSDEAYEKAAKVADVHNANCVNAYCDVHIWVAKAIRKLKESK